MTLSRCPAAARRELLEGGSLGDCREALARAGRTVELSCGALVFAEPHTVHHVETVLVPERQAAGVKLLGKHIICSCRFRPRVDQAIAQLRTREHVRIKSVERFLQQDAVPRLVNRRTFLEYCAFSSRHTTASTTVATLGWNPRWRNVGPL
uniref:Uncharacterized protein n=1 Tax=Alexandrium catenella TaxID=2925 RepID=A0A7S1RIE7_ALECA|mmetsp:Transcript_58117/g.155589  ORF Transcript_58117/g.155589 Transcript_58117/m.155589 type:complete len:151 (+) Transcript_58117:2-454(+)